jgi:hypothetical protein
MLAEAWQPGATYQRGQLVRWHGYLLRCQQAHTVLSECDDPWYERFRRQPLRERIGRWHVAFDEMKQELRDHGHDAA